MANNIFPKHKCGLQLNHNDHLNLYESINEYINERYNEFDDCWEDEESKQRAIDTNEIWELHWYPETPIGFYKVLAPTFEELISFAKKVEEENNA